MVVTTKITIMNNDDVDENDNNNSDAEMEDFINDRFSSLLKHILSIKAN